MRIIFCSDPLNPREVDGAYLEEAEAAVSNDLSYELVNFEALVYEGNAEKAARRIGSADESVAAIYRGWMLTTEQYERLYGALLEKNVRLINDPREYRNCHYLPDSLAWIEEHTPKSEVIPIQRELDRDSVTSALRKFGNAALLVKDYVKSRKHEWVEACFIPSAADTNSAMRVIDTFVERQGEDLQGGLVLREFVELEPLATHSLSGMPLTKEYRIFFLDKLPVYAVQYWEEGDYESEMPPVQLFEDVAKVVESNFFTMDVAKQRDSEWIIVELGDGQVAGLPERANTYAFYKELEGRWKNKQ